MHLPRLASLAFLAGCSSLVIACLDQYDPARYTKREHQEWEQATHVPPRLTATGEIPAAGAQVVSTDERYATLCASCHGPKGMGDGPAGAALNPHPRNFHDKAWQAKVDDAHIAKVITGGGASAGLSAQMPPWGSVLSPEEIQAIVKKIRAFGQEG